MMSFDVFLSFKNTDKNGKQTRDAEMAAELYNALSSLGIKTFFSNETLSDLGIMRYKTAIDDALEQAKVLIAVGTSLDHLTSNWVRYEWDGFYNVILSGRKVGEICSFIDVMTCDELPRSLRQCQCFEYKKNSVTSICRYITNSLMHLSNEEKQDDTTAIIAYTGELKRRSYTDENEAQRLSIQEKLIAENNKTILGPYINQLSNDHKINVLWIPCNDGSHVKTVLEQFETLIDKVVCTDREEVCINLARSKYNEPYHFEMVDFRSEEWERQLSSIMQKHDIQQFDLIVSNFIQLEQKAFVKLRRVLKSNGIIYVLGYDDDEIIAFPDDNSLIRNTLVDSYSVPGISDRRYGRKVYSHVFQAGYRDIHVKSYYLTTSEMNPEDRVAFFRVIFQWRKDRYKNAISVASDKEKALERYGQYLQRYEEIEERFYNPSFYFCVSGPIVIAKK